VAKQEGEKEEGKTMVFKQPHPSLQEFGRKLEEEELFTCPSLVRGEKRKKNITRGKNVRKENWPNEGENHCSIDGSH